eukprot:jgi/Astpho2/4480/e_gw1.00067.94.1_t
MVAGTRGDVQPFIALGLRLQEYGHRVRLASHAVYREFVTSFGLSFYPLGGRPEVLSDYIVKNRGIFPGSAKDAYDNYSEVEDIVMSTFDSCVEPDEDGTEFVAEAIIANPPSYGHIHCAEKLGIPCHMFFTMPWSPTKYFPQPLARLNHVEDSRMIGIRNYLSYLAVDDFTWAGLVIIFNKFRVEKLGLAPIRLGNKVPFGYCWSEALIPKPADWGQHIDVVGYFFLNESTRMTYNPPQALTDFLAAGTPPVYVGFGSLLVDNPKKVTQMILDAVATTKQRLLLSKGWANLGEGCHIPDHVLLLDNVPHDWLLPQCSAVVHHGGAGTTAAGLMAACPTLIIPFFGDQSFWGGAVARRGVGPEPIPIDELTTEKLTEAFDFLKDPSAKKAAQEIAGKIATEDGVAAGVEAFHKHLPLERMATKKPLKWHLVRVICACQPAF